jgi:hypothetical protein
MLDDDYQFQSSLPISWTGAMIRQLVVLDAHANNTEDSGGGKGVLLPMHELRILPAGRRGVLPNAGKTSRSSGKPGTTMAAVYLLHANQWLGPTLDWIPLSSSYLDAPTFSVWLTSISFG